MTAATAAQRERLVRRNSPGPTLQELPGWFQADAMLSEDDGMVFCCAHGANYAPGKRTWQVTGQSRSLRRAYTCKGRNHNYV